MLFLSLPQTLPEHPKEQPLGRAATPRNSVGGDGDKQPILLSLLLWKQRLKETPLEESHR